MWPVPHGIMFLGMFLLHVAVMPFVMIAYPSDFKPSLNQVYMGLHMATWMVLLEAVMHPMPGRAWFVSIVLLVITAAAVRFQWFVSDSQYLRDMIPHHSMAVLTSQQILKKSPQAPIQTLATNILDTQVQEIQTMKGLLEKMRS